jgi:hypothetical protein
MHNMLIIRVRGVWCSSDYERLTFRVNLHTDDTGILAGTHPDQLGRHGRHPAAWLLAGGLGNRSKRDRIRVLSLRPDRRQAHPSGGFILCLSVAGIGAAISLCLMMDSARQNGMRA